MRLQLSTKGLSSYGDGFIVVPVLEGGVLEAGKESLVKVESVQNFLKDNPKFGKTNDLQLFYIKNTKIILIGVGKKDKIDFATLQNYAGTATKYLLNKTKEAALVLPKTDRISSDKIGEALAIGAEIASYDPTKEFKSEKETAKLNSLEILVERAERGYQDGLKKGQTIAVALNQARYLGDLPPNLMTPQEFLLAARKVAREQKLKVTVLDEKKAATKGLGAFVAVAKGSDEPSYMIVLEYSGNIRNKDKWAIIGKGITFDSGGLYAKPAPHMDEMKYDMCGAAATLATMMAIAKLGLKVNVVGIMAVTENMSSGKAMKPGEIIRMYSGKTSEVLHTDAEGRLVLHDAVALAQKDYKATKIIDLATLTGAVIVALSHHYTGTFSNNEQFQDALIEAGKRVGEKYWPFPMSEEYDGMIKGEMSDIINVGKPDREAGSITGAKFIEAAVKDNTPWIHLDIAGTAWDSKSKPFRAIGATGVGVKTLVELLSQG